jgi:hypothetical protein
MSGLEIGIREKRGSISELHREVLGWSRPRAIKEGKEMLAFEVRYYLCFP